MPITPAELKKIKKMKEEFNAIKNRAAKDFSDLSIKYNLWQLDKKSLEEEFKEIANRHHLSDFDL